MPREPFTLPNQSYSLAHLEPFTAPVLPTDDKLVAGRVLVTFSSHVFTKEWNEDEHDPAHAYAEDGEQRCFCPTRHTWSQSLETIIRYHVGGKAYLGRSSKGIRNNFFYEQQNGRFVPYPVYFNLGRADRAATVDAVLHVLSAYENTELRGRHNYSPMRFSTLYDKKIGFKKAK